MSLLLQHTIYGGGGGTTTPPDTSPYVPINYAGTVNREQQNITESELNTYYYGWPVTYAVADKRAMVFRKGSTHVFSNGSEMVKYETADGGNTWTRTVLHSEVDIDTRNYGGGNTSTGVVILFYARWLGSAWSSMRTMRSVDGGVTFTHSSNLTLYPGINGDFSPHGRMIELENGDLIQAFYGNIDTYANCVIWTMRSQDEGLTWSVYTAIATGLDQAYEPDLVYLGGGKIIAAFRHDISGVDVSIYNSSDYGATYTHIGTLQYGGYDVAGVSPLLIKKDANNAYFIATWRGSVNNFTEFTLPFGSATASGLTRVHNPGLPGMDGFNIDFGYPRPLDFKGTTDDMMMCFYNTSTRWTGSGSHITDILVGPVFRKKRTVTVTPVLGHDYAAGINVFYPGMYKEDELPCYDYADTPTYLHVIRDTASYNIAVEATIGEGNATGTHRTFRIKKYNSSNVFVSTLDAQSNTNSNSSIAFDVTESLTAGERIVLEIEHDATSSLTTHIELTIVKQ